MLAHCIGHGPGLAAPEAASSGGIAGAASMGAVAPARPRLSAQKETALAAQAAQSRDQKEQQNFATGTRADKAFHTLRAHLALRGYSLHRTEADDGPVSFYVTRCGMTSEMRDLVAVARFLDRVGGAHA